MHQHDEYWIEHEHHSDHSVEFKFYEFPRQLCNFDFELTKRWN